MKIKKTFTIEKEIVDKFLIIAKKNSINMSLWIENKIKDYINNDK